MKEECVDIFLLLVKQYRSSDFDYSANRCLPIQLWVCREFSVKFSGDFRRYGRRTPLLQIRESTQQLEGGGQLTGRFVDYLE